MIANLTDSGRRTTARSLRRDVADRVLDRSEWLDQADRALVAQVIGNGARTGDLARIAGVSPRTIQRRIAKLIDRLLDPEVVHVLREHQRWPAPTRSVALAVWVRGRTLRQAAAELRLSLHQVRQQLQLARGLMARATQRSG